MQGLVHVTLPGLRPMLVLPSVSNQNPAMFVLKVKVSREREKEREKEGEKERESTVKLPRECTSHHRPDHIYRETEYNFQSFNSLQFFSKTEGQNDPAKTSFCVLNRCPSE